MALCCVDEFFAVSTILAIPEIIFVIEFWQFQITNWYFSGSIRHDDVVCLLQFFISFLTTSINFFGWHYLHEKVALTSAFFSLETHHVNLLLRRVLRPAATCYNLLCGFYHVKSTGIGIGILRFCVTIASYDIIIDFEILRVNFNKKNHHNFLWPKVLWRVLHHCFSPTLSSCDREWGTYEFSVVTSWLHHLLPMHSLLRMHFFLYVEQSWEVARGPFNFWVIKSWAVGGDMC